MNTQALKKCLMELEKESPNLAYIRGILETVVDISDTPVSTIGQQFVPAQAPFLSAVPTNNAIELTDEEREQNELIRRYNGGAVAELQ